MSFACFVEYSPERFAETACVKADASFAFRLILWAARCIGNIDSLMIAVSRWAQKHGHSSAVLTNLGVKTTPDSAPPEGSGYPMGYLSEQMGKGFLDNPYAQDSTLARHYVDGYVQSMISRRSRT
jgi:hypothetical protein